VIDEEWLRGLVLSIPEASRLAIARALVSFETSAVICCCSMREDPAVWNLDRLFWSVRAVQMAILLEREIGEVAL